MIHSERTVVPVPGPSRQPLGVTGTGHEFRGEADAMVLVLNSGSSSVKFALLHGFHGTSHRFVSERATELLGRPPGELCLVTAHLGNGCSLAAVRGGVSVDTTMGLTPLEGLVMGTRSGGRGSRGVRLPGRSGRADHAARSPMR